MTEIKGENTYSYDKYKETVKRCVAKYQKENRPKLNEYMRNYLSDPEKKKKHYESIKKYRAKKKLEREKIIKKKSKM